MGAVGGLIIVGVAFIVPRIIGETVVEPVGGNIGGTEAGQNCDDVLRNQFVFQRNASTPSALQAVISVIQNQRVDQCSVDVWKPVVVGSGVAGITGTGCAAAAASAVPKVGTQTVPSGLVVETTGGGRRAATKYAVRADSGRDRDNNIIVHWSATDGQKPTDDAKCWLYVSRLSTWAVE